MVALVSVLMVTAAITGGAGATTPSVDTSGSDATSTTTGLPDEGVIDNVSGVGNDTWRMQVNVTPDDTVEMKIERNGSSTVVFRNTSPENLTASGASNQGAHYNLSFSESDIDDLERTLDENVTIDVTTYDADNETGNETQVQIYLNFSDGRTVENIDDTDADEDSDSDVVTLEAPEESFLDLRVTALGVHSSDFSTLDVDDRDIDGENSEVVLVFSNDSVSDDAAAAVASDADDGDALFAMPLTVTGDETTRLIRVYNEEPADSVDDDDDGDTYGVYKEGGVGGEDGIVIHLGEDFEDDEEVAVTGTLNAGWLAQQNHRISTSSWTQSLGLQDGSIFHIGFGNIAGGAFGSLSVLLVIGAPTRRRKPVEEVLVFEDEE